MLKEWLTIQSQKEIRQDLSIANRNTDEIVFSISFLIV